MAVGRKIVVMFHEVALIPVIDQVDFTGSFTYTAPYVSNVAVKKDDFSGSVNDRFIVTYFWADGEGPDLGTVTVAALLADAVVQVNAVLPGDVVTAD